MLFKGLTRLFSRPGPPPTFENVIPTGRGWYRFQKGKWRRCEVRGYDARARWLSDNRLKELALDQVIANRGIKKRRGG